MFRITHPFHPLFGREFDKIAGPPSEKQQLLYFHDSDGVLRTIPREFTSFATPDPFAVIAAGRVHLSPRDLLKVAEAVEKWRDDV